MIKINLKNIPPKPGVYLFKDEENRVLYVGKAKNLKKRLKQYLLSNSPKIKNLLEKAKIIEFLETGNEASAIFKESDLIKKLKPSYNQLLRDDSRYFYLIFTKEKFPKLVISHQPEKFQAERIIGPFIEGMALKEILKIIRKDIPYCTCLKEHQRICLNASLGLCYGFCCQKEKKFTEQDLNGYQENIKLIEKIFTHNISELKKTILKKIKNFLKNNDLEKAQKLQRVYLSIKKIEIQENLIQEKESYLLEHQYRRILEKLKEIFNLEKLPHRIEVLDIAHFAGKEKVGIIITFIDGIYQSQFLKRFKIKMILKPDDPRMIYEVLKRRLKHKDWGYPDLILVDGGKLQFKFALKAIEECGLKIKLIALAKPKKEIYYDLKKKPLTLKKFKEIRDFILALDKKAHQLVLRYHRQKREFYFSTNLSNSA